MSLFAVKRVGDDFKSSSVLLGRVAPGGLNTPTLDSSYALDYTPGNTVVATQMPDHPSWCEMPAAPAFSAFANFSGNPYPLQLFIEVKSIGWAAGLTLSNSWIVELEFDEADIVKTFPGGGAGSMDVWLAQATVTRQFSRSDPIGTDGFDVLTDQDPDDYVVPEVP
jgi:hypothetical protein